MPALELMCIPWAGGVAGAYVAWSDGLRPARVVPLELPGRGTRYCEPAIESWADALDAIAGEWQAHQRPVVLFGHSMGAILAYEFARQMESQLGVKAAGLILSGAAAPHCRQGMLNSRMTDRELALSLVNAGGTPRELLKDPQFLAEYLSLLKTDLRLLESHRWLPGPGVSCPVYALAGRLDPYAPPDAVKAWSEHVTGPFTFRDYPGGHFYFKSQLPSFLSDLKGFLEQCESHVHSNFQLA